ncbi:hypothetical protein PsYK624_026130 [Phanerochaete sordida]|uniref:Uncharacterized protein n=1 Tax=Phanerochaete sordida TaxID=48140 RepID=A0A9P3LA14_9APHY|nr:hypothetical protein PsYK624_026130 [Phanerochaete sordida]
MRTSILAILSLLMTSGLALAAPTPDECPTCDGLIDVPLTVRQDSGAAAPVGRSLLSSRAPLPCEGKEEPCFAAPQKRSPLPCEGKEEPCFAAPQKRDTHLSRSPLPCEGREEPCYGAPQ